MISENIAKKENYLGDLWQKGYAITDWSEIFIQGENHQVKDVKVEYILQTHRSSMINRIEYGRNEYMDYTKSFNNTLIGFLYDGKNKILSLYCNRNFVCVLFDEIPSPFYAACSNGTGPVELRCRFYGDFIPPPIPDTGFDNFIPKSKAFIDNLFNDKNPLEK